MRRLRRLFLRFSAVFLILGVILPFGAMILWKSFHAPLRDIIMITVLENWIADVLQDERGRPLADFVIKDDRSGAEELLATKGLLYPDREKGQKHGWSTSIRKLTVNRLDGSIFAEWTSNEERAMPDTESFKNHVVPIKDKEGNTLGKLTIKSRSSYFGTMAMRELDRFQFWYDLLPTFCCVLLAVLGFMLLKNRIRLYMNTEELRKQQQMRIDFAKQMSHEFGNALYAFGSETQNIQGLIDQTETFLTAYPRAFEQALVQNAVDPLVAVQLKMMVEYLLDRQQMKPEDLRERCRINRIACNHLVYVWSYLQFTVGKLNAALLGKEIGGPVQPVSLRAAWLEVRALLSFRLHQAGIEPREEFEGTEQEEMILGEYGALQQVFFNLVKNAVEALKDKPPPRQLVFKTELCDDCVECSLTNTGPPIAPEILPHLFQRDFTTKSNGKGIGLKLARNLVQRMRGSIEVTSTAAEGTTFCLRFPRLPAETIHVPASLESSSLAQN